MKLILLVPFWCLFAVTLAVSTCFADKVNFQGDGVEFTVVGYASLDALNEYTAGLNVRPVPFVGSGARDAWGRPQAVVSLHFIRYANTDIGPYDEVILSLVVQPRDQNVVYDSAMSYLMSASAGDTGGSSHTVGTYMMRLILDGTDSAQVQKAIQGGRILGFPKFKGSIQYQLFHNPLGTDLFQASVREDAGTEPLRLSIPYATLPDYARPFTDFWAASLPWMKTAFDRSVTRNFRAYTVNSGMKPGGVAEWIPTERGEKLFAAGAATNLDIQPGNGAIGTLLRKFDFKASLMAGANQSVRMQIPFSCEKEMELGNSPSVSGAR